MKSLFDEERKKKADLEAAVLQEEKEKKQAAFEKDRTSFFEELKGSLEKNELKIGETLEITLYLGKPEEYESYSSGKKKTVKGKIKDIKYEPNSDYPENGEIVLDNKGMFCDKKSYSLKDIVGFRYHPEEKDAELKRQKEKAEKKEKEYEEKRRKSNYIFSAYSSHYGNSINVRHNRISINGFELGGVMKEAAERCGFECYFAHGDGPSTGHGYGSLWVYGVLNKGKIVALAGCHEGQYFTDLGIQMHTEGILGECRRYDREDINPNLSSIATIQDNDLRVFIAKMYEVMGDKR